MFSQTKQNLVTSDLMLYFHKSLQCLGCQETVESLSRLLWSAAIPPATLPLGGSAARLGGSDGGKDRHRLGMRVTPVLAWGCPTELSGPPLPPGTQATHTGFRRYFRGKTDKPSFTIIAYSYCMLLLLIATLWSRDS